MASEPRMDKTDRDVLDHFKEGLSPRVIAGRLLLEVTDVQATITELAGGDRTKAAALVVDYDRRTSTTPAPAPARKPNPARKPAAPRPAAPSAPAEDTPAPAPADPIPAELGDPAAAAWDGLDQAVTPVLVAALAEQAQTDRCTHGADCPIHPDAWGLHNYDNRAAEAVEAALAGPTDPLPAVASFEDLLAGVEVAGDPQLRELAARITTLVDQLHDGYARARRIRFVRAEAVQLRRQLGEHLAMLARLEAGDPGNNAPALAAAA
jgi:hypothetical protein